MMAQVFYVNGGGDPQTAPRSKPLATMSPTTVNLTQV